MNNDLSGLVLSQGDLSPQFNPSVTSYSSWVENTVSTVTMTATATDPAATISVNGNPVTSGVPSNPVSLLVGINNLTVVVTAQSGATKTYTVVMARYAIYRTPGMGFGPWLSGQSPARDSVGIAQLHTRLRIVQPYTNFIRTYGATRGQQFTGQVAHALGMRIAFGIWLGRDMAANEVEMNNAMSAGQRGEVDVFVVGNEVLHRNDLTPAQLVSYISRIKTAFPDIPVTTGEIYSYYIAHPELRNAVDVIYAHFYPFWEGTHIDYAMSSLHRSYLRLAAVSGNKSIVVAETGWPSSGSQNIKAVPSPANAALYFLNFVSWAKSMNVDYHYFEACNEDWKVEGSIGVGPHWGVFFQNGIIKPGMETVFAGSVMDDNWSANQQVEGTGVPFLEFFHAPQYGVSNNAILRGRVYHVRPADVKVFVYIKVAGRWWPKPSFDNLDIYPFPDGTWEANIRTGGIDEQATSIKAWVVPAAFSHPGTSNIPNPPASVEQNAICKLEIERHPVSRWSITDRDSTVEFGFGSGGNFPQYGVFYKRDGYLRLIHPGGNWGTSEIVPPVLWEAGRNDNPQQGAAVNVTWADSGAILTLAFNGSISTLDFTGRIRVFPPGANTTKATISVYTSGQVELEDRPGEAFKPGMLSSMRVSADSFDTRGAFIDARTLQIPQQGWINQPPIDGSLFGLTGGTSAWKINAPTVEYSFDRILPVSGWVTQSNDPNDDNVGFWNASDSVLPSWHYHVTVSPAP